MDGSPDPHVVDGSPDPSTGPTEGLHEGDTSIAGPVIWKQGRPAVDAVGRSGDRPTTVVRRPTHNRAAPQPCQETGSQPCGLTTVPAHTHPRPLSLRKSTFTNRQSSLDSAGRSLATTRWLNPGTGTYFPENFHFTPSSRTSRCRAMSWLFSVASRAGSLADRSFF